MFHVDIKFYNIFDYGTINTLGKSETTILFLLNSIHEEKIKQKPKCLKIFQKFLISSTNAI